MDNVLIGAVAVAAVAVIAAAYFYLKSRRVPEEETGPRVTEEHIIEKMDTILRYQNADRP